MITRVALAVAITLAVGLVPAGAEPAPVGAEPARAAWFDAARDGDLAALRTLAGGKPGALLDAADASGYTALILASYHDHAAAVRWLVAAKASACQTDTRGYTALMGAVFRGHAAIVEILARQPCGADFVTVSGQTPLMLAALFGRTEIARHLLAAGADPTRRDAQGNDARSLAVAQGHDALVAVIDAALRARR